MNKQITLKELGFKQSKENSKRDIPDSNKRLFKGAYSISLDELRNKIHNHCRHLPKDAPPDTGIGGGGHDDLADKDDSGFMSYMGEKWNEGYPR